MQVSTVGSVALREDVEATTSRAHGMLNYQYNLWRCGAHAIAATMRSHGARAQIGLIRTCHANSIGVGWNAKCRADEAKYFVCSPPPNE